jgi:hypothetical protein
MAMKTRERSQHGSPVQSKVNIGLLDRIKAKRRVFGYGSDRQNSERAQRVAVFEVKV